jgi:hypothetical protein
MLGIAERAASTLATCSASSVRRGSTAFANPRLVEEQEVLINGVPRDILVYHIGNRRIWGLTARVLQNLLVRLGLEPEEDKNVRILLPRQGCFKKEVTFEEAADRIEEAHPLQRNPRSNGPCDRRISGQRYGLPPSETACYRLRLRDCLTT